MTGRGALPEEGLADKEAERTGLATLTVTLSLAVPPGPLQVMVYLFELVRLPVDSEPEVDLEPDQSPEALQELALLDVQERVAEEL